MSEMNLEDGKNWSFLTCIAYSYIAFTGLTHGDLKEEELQVILSCLKEWSPAATDDEIMEACTIAHSWFIEDMEENAVSTNVTALAHKLNVDEFEGNERTKKSFLDDLVRISIADSNFEDNEKALIMVFADVFGLSEYHV
tara:strand:+ start:1816 stop:2235 length:420 start_codon:yes stop_codon:yes gene_type:complete